MGLAARCVLVLVTLLVAAPPAMAWHWEDETESERFGSRAGDPRVLEEAGACAESRGAASCLVLYAHVLALLGVAPLNTQRPPDCGADLAHGFSGAPGIEPYWEFNQIVFRSHPHFVAYTESCEHTARANSVEGLAADLRLSRAVAVTGHLFLSADATEFSPAGVGVGPDSAASAGAIPCLTVRMTLETGRFAGAGEILATGETTKTIVSLPTQDGPPIVIPDACPGARGVVLPAEVTEFEVELGPVEATLVEGEPFVVQARWFQWELTDVTENDTRVVQHQWNMHTGPEYPNRVVLAVEPALEIRGLELRQAASFVFLAADIHAPLGAYDLDTDNVRVTLIAPDGSATRIPTSEYRRYDLARDDPTGTLRLVHAWDRDAAAGMLPPGLYTVQYEIANWQHTEVAKAALDLWVASDGEWTTSPQTSQHRPGGLDWQRDEIALLVTLTILATGAVYLSAVAGRLRRP